MLKEVEGSRIILEERDQLGKKKKGFSVSEQSSIRHYRVSGATGALLGPIGVPCKDYGGLLRHPGSYLYATESAFSNSSSCSIT